MAKAKTDLEPLLVTAWRRREEESAEERRVRRAAKAKRPHVPWPPEAATIGVYALLHRPSRSVYIGYTAGKQGFKARWRNHKRLLFILKDHHCSPLQTFVEEFKLRPRDFELLILSSYPARPRTKDLVRRIVREEVEFWDLAEGYGYTMLCERPLGVPRKYVRHGKSSRG